MAEQHPKKPWVVLLCNTGEDGRFDSIARVWLVPDEETARAAHERIGALVRERGLLLLVEPAIPHETAENVARHFYSIDRIWLGGD